MKSIFLIPLVAVFAADTASALQNLSPELAIEDPALTVDFKPVPRISVAGEPVQAETMNEYADQLGVPAASWAVYRDGEIVHQAFKGDGIGPDSIFQGASLAKAVSSATIATLAMREGISLDEDIAPYITSFDLTSLGGYEAPVTLRQLLSHTSRADVEGFPGYPQSAALPTNLDVILGSDKTNTEPVTFSRPTNNWYYSGGGYQIAQAFAEDVSGKPFDELAQELIFGPVGMSRTSFSQSMDPEAVKPLVPVSGFENSGPVEGGWYNYPELAAAGLWTTAEDYGRFITAIMAAAGGETDTGISPEVAKEMLTVAGQAHPLRGYGLGLGILLNDEVQMQSFEHHGKNEGYRVSFSAFPKERGLSIMLTNHPKGLLLATETNRGFGMSLGYVDPSARTVTRVALPDDLRKGCLGAYAAEDATDETVSLISEDNTVIFRDEDSDYPLVHLGNGDFLHTGLAVPFKCETTEQRTTLRVGSSALYVKQ